MKYIEPLSFRLRKKAANMIYKIGNLIMPSVTDRQFYLNNRWLIKRTLSKEFQWSKYVDSINTYFLQWGIKTSQLDAAYYGYLSGIKADHYVTRILMSHYLYPYLGRNEFVTAYMDKNIHKKVMQINGGNNSLHVHSTEDIIYNSNGVFFDGSNNEISKEHAISILTSQNNRMIIKPSIDTYGGKGVEIVDASSDPVYYSNIFQVYKQNFAIQNIVKQHNDMAAFNETSINTVRIVTYRKPNKERKVLYAVLRFGGAGSIKDNACSGGGHTGINIEDGTLRNRLIYRYYDMSCPKMKDSLPNRIPSWEKIVKTVLKLHEYLPHFDVIGWDISVRPDGDLTLIEYNLRPDPELQDCVGPMFSQEDLEELMSHVVKSKITTMHLCQIKYEDMPDRQSLYTKWKI